MNYHRFYALFRRLYGCDEELKATLVSNFTDGRTTHLSEMTKREYDALCNSLDERSGWRVRLKRYRSVCLNLMQHLGIDTTDWARVNDFCRHPRIAGREFSLLGGEDLQQLQAKLRAIQRKGGLNVKTEDAGCPKTVGDGCPQAKPAGTVASEDVYMVVPIGKGGEA